MFIHLHKRGRNNVWVYPFVYWVFTPLLANEKTVYLTILIISIFAFTLYRIIFTKIIRKNAFPKKKFSFIYFTIITRVLLRNLHSLLHFV